MSSEFEKANMHARVRDRFDAIQRHVQKLHNQIDAGQIGGEGGRIWLERFCAGKGVQFCSGDFALGDSLGVEIDWRKLAMDMWGLADRFLCDLPPQDYVVTNTLELFPDTLRVLTEWARLLRPEGVLAIVCRDAEAYEEPEGPLANRHRCSCFTITTLRCYLERAGYEVFSWENLGKELRVAARRKA